MYSMNGGRLAVGGYVALNFLQCSLVGYKLREW